MIMMKDRSSSLPPMPITDLTLEQEFKMRQLTDGVERATKDDLITILLALQRQTFVLGNNLKQLLDSW